MPEAAEPVDVGVAEEHAVADEPVTNAPEHRHGIVMPHAPSNSDDPDGVAGDEPDDEERAAEHHGEDAPRICATQIVPAPVPGAA